MVQSGCCFITAALPGNVLRHSLSSSRHEALLETGEKDRVSMHDVLRGTQQRQPC